MSKQAKRRQHRQPARGPSPIGTPASFNPVALRARHDGWTPARQIAFIQSLAETANVEEACRMVGMSPRAAYTLRNRPDAGSFRQAWALATDYAVTRLADAMLGRALNGVATPIFYKGEQIGEQRRYDERLAMFLLRAHAPERYGKWRDTMQQTRDHPDGAALMLHKAVRHLGEDAVASAAGKPRPQRAPIVQGYLADDPEVMAAIEAERERQEEAAREAEWQAYLNTVQERTTGSPRRPDLSDDVS